MDLLIRPMSRDELDLAVQWAADEGWNPGLRDADCFYQTDPDGFLMAFGDGEPVASISVVRDGAFAFLGFYIVRSALRGRGYGRRIWQAGIERLHGCCTIGLDGVVAQQANYAMSGFVLAHQNVRYGGEVQVKPPSDPRLSTITEDLISEIVASAFRVSDRSWRRRTTDPGKHWCCWRLALPGSRSPLERLAAIVCVCGAAHREPGRRRVDSGSGALAHQMQRAMGAPDAPHPAASPSAHADSKRGC